MNCARSAARWPSVFAAYQFDSQSTIASANRSGARESASTPPASTRFERPARMLLIAESIACMPDAQLRITVQPGTFSPQPIRNATTRPMFTSSTDGAAQPRITSSSSVGAKRLANEHRSPGRGGEVRRRERSRAVARLEERRPRAVDDVDRFVHVVVRPMIGARAGAAALTRRPCASLSARPVPGPKGRPASSPMRRGPARNRRRGSPSP